MRYYDKGDRFVIEPTKEEFKKYLIGGIST